MKSASDIIDSLTAKHGNTVHEAPCSDCGNPRGMEVIPPDSGVVSLCQPCLYAKHGLTAVRMKLLDPATKRAETVILLMTDDQLHQLDEVRTS